MKSIPYIFQLFGFLIFKIFKNIIFKFNIIYRIKKDQFLFIGEEWSDIILVLFEELAEERDNYSTASQWIGELLVLWKKMEELKLSELLKQNLLLLESKCKKLCEDEDIEAIETYALMFTDLGDWNVKNIIKTGDIRILDILQHFFKIEGKHFKAWVGFFSYFWDSLIENHPDKNRRKEIIIHFKDFFESLINTIMTKSIMPENKFLDFNNKFEGHHDFDEIFNIRKDLGGLLKKLGLCIGNYEMYELLIVQLQELLTKEETNLEDINIIIQLENLLFAISFWIQLIDNQDEIQNFNTWLTLMFKIPSDKYAALRRAVIDIIFIISEFWK